ncbi:MAG: hypothetical protein WAS73_09375 [Defluviicoccus sp.]
MSASLPAVAVAEDALGGADRAYVFDNSGLGGERCLSAVIEGERLSTAGSNFPDWVHKFLVAPLTMGVAR